MSEVQCLPRCAVTLVHGTIPRIGPIAFFRKQQWMDSRSAFCEQISTHFDVVWLPFAWSGINSHSARIYAGKQLAAALCHNLAQYPSIPHYVISHSHGGNVAVYALKYLSPQEHRNIAGIITLGTPFIWSSIRDIATVRETLMACFKYGSITWLLAFLCISDASGFKFIGMLPLAVGILGLALWRFLCRYSIRIWEQESDRFDTLLDAGVPPVSLLCVMVNRDEAKMWVRAWEVLGRLLFGHWYMSLIEWILDFSAQFRAKEAIFFPTPQLGVSAAIWSIFATGVCAGLGLLLALIVFGGSALTIVSMGLW